MTVGRYFRLGWNQPLVNTLTGPDAPNLRRIFQSLQQWIEYPLIGLTGTPIANLAAATASVIVWSTELYDDFALHDTNGTTFRVPRQAQQYFVIGAFTANFDGAGAGRRSMSWLLNGAATNWNQTLDTATHINYGVCPYMGIVKRGDLLSTSVSHNVGVVQDIDNLELWMLFMPLGG